LAAPAASGGRRDAQIALRRDTGAVLALVISTGAASAAAAPARPPSADYGPGVNFNVNMTLRGSP
jgi:hypothetical protein